MRIRKGHRCLPLSPADRGSLEDGFPPRGMEGRVIVEGKEDVNQALLQLVAVAAAPVTKTETSGPGAGGSQFLEHATDTSAEGNKHLEYYLDMNRLSAGDNFEESSLIHESGVGSEVKKSTTPPSTETSVVSRRRPFVTTGTISSNTSPREFKDQPNLLEQSLRHICSTAGKNGLSAREAVARIIEQGLPGLNESGERLIVQVAKSFRSCPVFVEHEERGRYFLQDFPKREANKPLITEMSELSHEEEISRSAMVEAARQLQNLQRSHSDLRDSGVTDFSEVPSSHGGKQRGIQNITEGPILEPKREGNSRTVTAMSHKATSSVSTSQEVSPVDQPELQCKRDDGKGWRCARTAEAGFTMCRYHRDQIARAQGRRKKAKVDKVVSIPAKSPPLKYVANARAVSKAIRSASACPFLDDELAYDERRKFVKAKSLNALLVNNVRPKKR